MRQTKESDKHFVSMMIEAVCFSEILATAYHTTHCFNQEENGMNFRRRKIVKSETNKLRIKCAIYFEVCRHAFQKSKGQAASRDWTEVSLS
jgi:hypothetical protein